jgi:DNA-binding protein YbaB
MFDKMKQLYDLQKRAKEMQNSLEKIVVDRQSPDGRLKVSMNGNFKVTQLSIDDSALSDKAWLEKALKDLLSQTTDQVRSESSRQAMGMMKGMM